MTLFKIICYFPLLIFILQGQLVPGDEQEVFEREGFRSPYLVESETVAAWVVEMMMDVGVFNRRS